MRSPRRRPAAQHRRWIVALPSAAIVVVLIWILAGRGGHGTSQRPPVRSSGVPHLGDVALALGHTGSPFGRNFWGRPLPADTGVNPNSAVYVREIVAALHDAGPGLSHGQLQTTASPPLYVVPANQPYVRVHSWNPATDQARDIPTLNRGLFAHGIPIPQNAVPAVNTDSTIDIYQPSIDRLWELWKVRKDGAGGWEVAWGGRIDGVSQSNGIFRYPLGTAATGDSLVGVVPRIEELQAGHIDHPVELEIMRWDLLAKGTLPANTPQARASFSWPANRNDGHSTNPYAIPEGLRFRLDPSLNLNGLHLSPVAHAIAIAAQKYGFVVMNGIPKGVSIKLGNPQPYIAAGLPNPYIKLFGSDYGSNYSEKVMANFPWSHLQALPFNYGTNSGASG